MPATTATVPDVTAELAYLTRALKAPTMRQAIDRLADRERAEGWTHEQFLAACLEREVTARSAHGGELRVKAAKFPARKSLDDFDFAHASSIKRDQIAHLGTLDFITARENVIFLGPPGTGKTHLATGLAVLSRHVSHAADWRFAAERGVRTVVIVDVQPSRECLAAA
jgi:DNA replication protein DnaC